MRGMLATGRVYAIGLAIALASGCGGGGSQPALGVGDTTGPTTPRAGQDARSDPLVVFLGDSLTAGYGLPEARAFPAIVGRELEERRVPVRVVNAGVSGDTSAQGLSRLDWLLAQRPAVLVVGLGANDGLRGQPVEDLHRNLREIVAKARAARSRVLLLGMRAPPSLGPDYCREFDAVYPRVARETGVPLVPFLLEGVGGHPDLNLPDGIHPNDRGHEIVAANVRPYLEKLLR